ncbi:hypothetical protein FAEPRAM212_02282 [Faecalibacterium prausnitzii M21/2]|uniref:Uncharacterized protein n=1 Tax=Faecalibacterium prausnitzii M21/2 TaxID=411485 RepID=A8SDP2_9FIRM|nr:hypothetical protein FAEPRAM212_02282 [Faecalibacterium prausnitzii M21/2]
MSIIRACREYVKSILCIAAICFLHCRGCCPHPAQPSRKKRLQFRRAVL